MSGGLRRRLRAAAARPGRTKPARAAPSAPAIAPLPRPSTERRSLRLGQGGGRKRTQHLHEGVLSDHTASPSGKSFPCLVRLFCGLCLGAEKKKQFSKIFQSIWWNLSARNHTLSDIADFILGRWCYTKEVRTKKSASSSPGHSGEERGRER